MSVEEVPVLPAFIVREARGHYRIKIEKPVPLTFKGEGHMEMVDNVALLTRIIEKYVRSYPDQWGGWMHKRWKSKPVPGKEYQELEGTI